MRTKLISLAAVVAASLAAGPAAASSHEPFGFGNAERGSLRVVSGVFVAASDGRPARRLARRHPRLRPVAKPARERHRRLLVRRRHEAGVQGTRRRSPKLRRGRPELRLHGQGRAKRPRVPERQVEAGLLHLRRANDASREPAASARLARLVEHRGLLAPHTLRRWLSAPTDATSRSSRTWITARRRSSTRCSGSPARSGRTRRSPSACSTRWTSSARRASRSSPRTRPSGTGTSRSTSSTRRVTPTSAARSSAA